MNLLPGRIHLSLEDSDDFDLLCPYFCMCRGSYIYMVFIYVYKYIKDVYVYYV